MQIKQSVVLNCFVETGTDPTPMLRHAREIGCVGAEVWFPDASFERTVAIARELGLALVGMCGHKDWKSGLNVRANHERIEAELRQSIDLAARLGVLSLVCFAGIRGQTPEGEDSIENAVVGLRRVAPYAEQQGITLNLELLNSKVDHPGYEFDRTAWGVEVCRRVGSPRVKILYDIYHAQIMEGDVIRTLQANIQWIGHMHTAGNPGRHDLDREQELNYAAICKAIAATGYEGYVGHEFFPTNDRASALHRAFDLCNQA